MSSLLDRVAAMGGDLSQKPTTQPRVKEPSQSPPPAPESMKERAAELEQALKSRVENKPSTTPELKKESELKEIELPGYEEDLLFAEETTDTEIKFSASKELSGQKYHEYEAVTVRLDPRIVTRINDLRRKTTKERRKKLGSANVSTERLTNNSFYRAIMEAMISRVEELELSHCLTEEDLNEEIKASLKLKH